MVYFFILKFYLPLQSCHRPVQESCLESLNWAGKLAGNSEGATLKSLIEEHARLDFADFLSTLLEIFHVINEKFHPARSLIYLVNKQAGCHFLPSLLVYSGLLFY